MRNFFAAGFRDAIVKAAASSDDMTDEQVIACLEKKGPDMDPADLAKLSHRRNPEIRAIVAKHPNTPPSVKRGLTKVSGFSEEARIPDCLKSKKVTPEDLVLFSYHQSPRIRKFVAEHPDTPLSAKEYIRTTEPKDSAWPRRRYRR